MIKLQVLANFITDFSAKIMPEVETSRFYTLTAHPMLPDSNWDSYSRSLPVE